jgi:N-acetylmuramoyl-L-alanine amidase
MASFQFIRCMLFLLLLGGLPATAQALTFSTVILDAGHGGHDGGAAWYGLREKRLNLDVAQRVERLLKAKGLRVVMTRRTDTFVSLDARANTANRYARSVFVSIHFNANRTTSIHGMEGYYRSSKGKTLAGSILRSMDRRITGKNRGLINRNFKVLRSTRMPAAVIECGYISNRTEAKRCATPAHRQAIAEGIAAGILAVRG